MPIFFVFIGAATAVTVGAAIAGTLATLGFWGVVGYAALITAVTYVIGALTRPEGYSLNLGLRDRSQFTATPEVPRNIIYGEADVAPRILRVFTHDALGLRTLHILTSVADHPLEALTELYVNGEKFLSDAECATLSSGSLVTVPAGQFSEWPEESLRWKVGNISHTGAAARPAPMVALAGLHGNPVDLAALMTSNGLDGNLPADAFADHRMTGMSWLYLRFTNTIASPRTEDLIWDSNPQVKVRAKRGLANLVSLRGFSGYNSVSIISSRKGADLAYEATATGRDFTVPLPTWTIGGTDYGLKRIDVHAGYGTVELRGADDGDLPYQEFNSFLPATRMAIYNATQGFIMAEGPMVQRAIGDGSIYFTIAGPQGPQGADNDLMEIYLYTAGEAVIDIAEIRTAEATIPFRDDNAALCCFDYLAQHTNYGDFLFGEAQINADAFEVAALICEERSWSANGAFTLDDSPDAVLEQFQQCTIGGFLVDRAGVVELRAGGPRLSSFDITEDMVLEGWNSSPSLPRENRSSIISVEYAEPSDAGDLIRSVSVANLPAVEQFGEVTVRSDSLLINNKKQAVQYAQVQLLRQWDSMQVTLTTNAAPLGLGPSDTCTLTLPSEGINGKKFRVLRVGYNADLSLSMELYEEHDDAWDSIPADTTTISPVIIPNVGSGEAEVVTPPALIWGNAGFVTGEVAGVHNTFGWSDASRSVVGGSATGGLDFELGGSVQTLDGAHWHTSSDNVEFSTVEVEHRLLLQNIEHGVRIVMWRTRDKAVFCDAEFASNVGITNVGGTPPAEPDRSFFTRTILAQRARRPIAGEGFGVAIYTASHPVGSVSELGL